MSAAEKLSKAFAHAAVPCRTIVSAFNDLGRQLAAIFGSKPPRTRRYIGRNWRNKL